MEKKRLLLHVCCASCVVYVVEKLRDDYDITLFFYNPNIQPKKEYESRKQELLRISTEKGWPVVCPDYDMGEWFSLVGGLEKEPERGRRCSVCFSMRLRKAFHQAQASGFEVVATTLSISPYKVTAQIDAEGKKLGQEFAIPFLDENFKKQDGYRKGRQMAAVLGITHQDYCGCVYSRVEKKTREKQTGLETERLMK